MESDLALLPTDFEDVFLSDHDIQLRSPFRLLDLPPELWISICNYAVLRSRSLKIGRENTLKDSAAIVRQPAITRTCNSLRRESLPLFYSSNNFEMYHSYDVPCPRHWLLAIGSSRRKRMGTFLMHSNCDEHFWKGSFGRAGINVIVTFLEDHPERLPGSFSFLALKTYKVSFI